MDPVEINAGAWYLRALRDDDRVSDVPALDDLVDSSVLAGETPATAVVEAAAGWRDGTRLSWAVCVPTTGELIALAVLVPDDVSGTGRLHTAVTRVGDAPEALAAGCAAIGRFAEGALGLRMVE